MSYVNPDYPTKRAFLEAVKAGVPMDTYNPSGMFPTVQDGTDVVEGPQELLTGYLARFSAPGYLDCTEWAVFPSHEAAAAYLAEQEGE
jgi:hypothetical protein